MTTKSKNIDERQIDETIEDMEKILNQWQTRLDHLQEEIHLIKKDLQRDYQDQVDNLQQQLDTIGVRLQAISEGDPKEWVEGQSGFNEKLADFSQRFMNVAKNVKSEDQLVALGWLQGFSDKRTHTSEGWAEGMGEISEDSEGWAEGMGKQGSDSKGWLEGYDS